MTKKRVLFISQEVTPYLEENNISNISRHLPQAVQEGGKEVRVFMPRYGCINERRHQLHEVIRLSGMNLIIDDNDHPLIIKVASIQQARMQVYFIDNEDYFKRKSVLQDDKGKCFTDNDERSIFFCRGVLETVKKLGWTPDVVHCHGWMTSLIPLYLKTIYKDDPVFENTKIVYSLYDNDFPKPLNKDFYIKAKHDKISDEMLEPYKDSSFTGINKAAIDLSDGVIMGCDGVNSELAEYAKSIEKPSLEACCEETYKDKYSEFYDKIIEEAAIELV